MVAGVLLDSSYEERVVPLRLTDLRASAREREREREREDFSYKLIYPYETLSFPLICHFPQRA